jgi:hypothetical protein
MTRHKKSTKQAPYGISRDTFFADYYKNGNLNNLIFHTDHPLAWRSAILTQTIPWHGTVLY